MCVIRCLIDILHQQTKDYDQTETDFNCGVWRLLLVLTLILFKP